MSANTFVGPTVAPRSLRFARPDVLFGILLSLIGIEPSKAEPDRRTCVDTSFPIYFSPNGAEIDKAAQATLVTALRPGKNCEITSATVVGRGDAFGAGKGNSTLARERAEAVASELLRFGSFKGNVNIVPRPGSNAQRPVLERRVTVHLHRRLR